MGKIAALIVAGGRGERAGGGVAKQYRPLLGKPVLAWTVSAFRQADLVQVVIGASDGNAFAAATAGLKVLPPAAGGPNRQESVRLGLEALSAHSPEFVLIHDAARPLGALCRRCRRDPPDAHRREHDQGVHGQRDHRRRHGWSAGMKSLL